MEIPISPPAIKKPVSILAITTGKLLLKAVACLADHFSSPLPCGGSVSHHSLEPPTAALQLTADEDFTLTELH